MSKIYCIVGKSCSGKDTIYNSIIKKNKYLKPIVTYTTRPIRQNEINGKEYIFVDDNKFDTLKKNNKIIEYREYNTANGVWTYFMVDDGQINFSNNENYILITTLDGIKSLSKFYKNNIVLIHIFIDDEIRMQRAYNREKNSKKDYIEMCRRFISDDKDFKKEKFDELKIYENKIINNKREKCIDEILNIIKKNT